MEAQLQSTKLNFAQLQRANLGEAQLQGVYLLGAELQGANLELAQLQGAFLLGAELQGADLGRAQLQGAFLVLAKLQGANLREAQLQGVNLQKVTLADKDHFGPQLADVQWGDTNLAVVDWTGVTMIGDEYVAAQKIDQFNIPKDENERIEDHKTTVRAYRQLSVALRNQGLNEDAARFTYRAQLMQRKVYWYQRKYGGPFCQDSVGEFQQHV